MNVEATNVWDKLISVFVMNSSGRGIMSVRNKDEACRKNDMSD